MKRAQGIEDIGLGPAVKNGYTRYLPAGLAALIVAEAVFGVLVFGAAPSGWASHLVFGIAFAAFGALIGGLVCNANKVAPAVRFGRLDVMFSLESGEQKHVRRQIVGNAAVDREHLPVIRATAVQQRKCLATQLILMPFTRYSVPFRRQTWQSREIRCGGSRPLERLERRSPCRLWPATSGARAGSWHIRPRRINGPIPLAGSWTRGHHRT
ncbi:MAG: hypothetical protein ABI563_05650 [Specibacter sp.]